MTNKAETLGRFTLLHHLDDGGSSDVYRAHSEELGTIALKLLKPAARENPDEVERFLREGHLLEELSHPALPNVVDVGVEEDTPYIAMTLLQGQPLDAYLQAKGKLDSQRVLAIAEDIAAALVVVHTSNTVHRDLKPHNIFICDDDERAVLMDFGVARPMNHRTENRATPRYMSPEQASGMTLDGRSDLFSLGAILYELLSGSPPFPGKTLDALIEQVRTHHPAPLSDAGAAQPIVEQLLRKQPAKRYRSAGTLLRDIRKARAKAQRQPLKKLEVVALIALGIGVIAWLVS